MIYIDKDALEIINILNNHHFEAYLVGGCIRDALLGKKPNDYDITTNAKPKQIKHVFKDYKVIDVSGKCGTIIVHTKQYDYEITPYRLENAYLDHRHPTEVTFSNSLNDDLSRRDFTINAFAYNQKDGLIDLFNGQSDLDNKLIRCIGNPNKRFKEDALRILRALRFSSKLNFKIEEKTSQAIHDNKNLLQYISIERITDEFHTILLSDKIDEILNDYLDVIQMFLQVDKPYSISNAEKDFSIRLALLLQNSNQNLSSLHLENKTINEVNTLLKHQNDTFQNINTIDIKKLIITLGYQTLNKLLSFLYIKYDNPYYEQLKKQSHQVYLTMDCFSIHDLKIDGNDLINHGYSGKQIGNKLQHLFQQVIEEKLLNDRDTLLKQI